MFVELQFVVLPCLVVSRSDRQTGDKCEEHHGDDEDEEDTTRVASVTFRDELEVLSEGLYAKMM